MSLKLDELRKRLLQQQSAGEAPSPDPSSGKPATKIVGTALSKPEANTSKDSDPFSSKDLGAILINRALERSLKAAESAPEPAAVQVALSPIETNSQDRAERNSFEGPADSPEPKLSDGGLRLTGSASAPVATESRVQYELAEAVGKVFQQTKAFQERLAELDRIFEPIDRLGASAIRAFAPLQGFQKQMAQLARSFEPMRTFQQQLSQLAQDFEPMKALEGQLSQLADSFQAHIGDLIKALEPAKQMRDRIEQLAAAFDQATELQAEFTQLYDAFELSPSSNVSHANGLDAGNDAAH